MEQNSFRSVPDTLSAPFLASKIQPPPRHGGLVERSRLTETLTAGDRCELTVVSGPAGSGKTSLLSDWARRDDRLVAWLKLDRHDNDPTQFWIGLLGAIASIDGEFAAHVDDLAATARVDQRVFLNALAERVAQSRVRPTVILDDLHEIREETIHTGLGLICDQLHHCLRLVVASRTTPPLGLARRRTRGQLCEIRFDDLRFTDDESSRLVENIVKESVSKEAMSQVQRTADGWAAALYVAAIALTSNPDADPDPGRADRHLSDYLLEEVLAREPEERQRFLLETSILDRLTPARCDAVTGRDDAAQVLRELERSNQFVTRVSVDGAWFSYHALLQDLLRAELTRQDRHAVADLHQRATTVALHEGDTGGAIHHALSSGALDQAAEIISESWIDFTNRGLFATVMGWLDEFRTAESYGTSTKACDPTVFVAGGWMALHTGRLDEVEHWLARAESTNSSGPLTDGSISVDSAVALVRSSHRRRSGAVGEALESSEIAVRLETDTSSPWRAVASVGYATSLYWSGDLQAASDRFDEALRIARAASLNVPIVLSLGYKALIYLQNQDLDAARTAANAAVALVAEARITSYDQAAPAFLAAGLCHLDAIELDHAQQSLNKALDLGRQGNERLVRGATRLALKRLAELRQDANMAATQWAAVEQLMKECADPGQILIDAMAAGPRPRSGAIGAVTFPALTERELTVLRYFRSSLTLPEIANELFVSPNTVKTHAASIRSKLSVTSREDAVRVAREIGLLTS